MRADGRELEEGAHVAGETSDGSFTPPTPGLDDEALAPIV
jgi:hypothetical protein